MSSAFTIGLVQANCGAGIDENIGRAQQFVRQAAAGGAQIICLQELYCSTYFCSIEDTANFSFAQPVSGPAVSAMRELARELQVVIIAPFFERRDAGVYHNSAAIIDADGQLLGVYRKMHIPDDPLYYEKFHFAPGDADSSAAGYRVFSTRYAKIGVLICWDQWYPEAARITSMLGAEVLFYPTAIGWHPAEKGTHGPAQRAAWQTMQRAHAIANGVYVAAANRVGLEPTPGTDGIEFFGTSFVSDPFGVVLAQATTDKEEVLVVECSRRLIEETRQLWPFFRDRRIDSYGPITKRWLAE